MKKLLIIATLFFCITSAFCTGSLPKDYRINDADENDATTKYYGYTKRTSDWWIVMRTSTTANVTEFEYAVGKDNYTVEWSTRAYLSYYDWDSTYSNPN